MSDLRLEREFPVSPARLFEAVTTRALLLQWWASESSTVRDEQLDLSQLGPWHSSIVNAQGDLYKMSGQVTRVVPDQVVGFTWAWHDQHDVRGDESHVTFTVQETPKGAKLIIDHVALPSDDSATQHTAGWSVLVARLEQWLGN